MCGDGGMVVASPTTRPEHAQPYGWKNPPGLFGFTECPAWLLDVCRKPATGDARSSGFRPNAAGASAWAQAALRAELADVFSAAGSTRNNALDAAAFALGQIVGGGSLGEEDVRARLIGAGLNIDLEEAETRATVNSGLRAGMAEPRTAPEERRRPRGGETVARLDARSESHPPTRRHLTSRTTRWPATSAPAPGMPTPDTSQAGASGSSGTEPAGPATRASCT